MTSTKTHVAASQKAISHSQSQQYKIDITSIAVGMAISCTSAYSLLRLSKRRRREFVSSPCCFNILISASWVWLASSEALIFFFRSSNSSRWLSITSWSAAATCFSSWTSASSSCTRAVLARCSALLAEGQHSVETWMMAGLEQQLKPESLVLVLLV